MSAAGPASWSTLVAEISRTRPLTQLERDMRDALQNLVDECAYHNRGRLTFTPAEVQARAILARIAGR